MEIPYNGLLATMVSREMGGWSQTGYQIGAKSNLPKITIILALSSLLPLTRVKCWPFGFPEHKKLSVTVLELNKEWLKLNWRNMKMTRLLRTMKRTHTISLFGTFSWLLLAIVLYFMVLYLNLISNWMETDSSPLMRDLVHFKNGEKSEMTTFINLAISGKAEGTKTY